MYEYTINVYKYAMHINLTAKCIIISNIFASYAQM